MVGSVYQMTKVPFQMDFPSWGFFWNIIRGIFGYSVLEADYWYGVVCPDWMNQQLVTNDFVPRDYLDYIMFTIYIFIIKKF